MSENGHDETKTGGIAADHLRSFIERVERLEEEKSALLEDIREVYAEAKGAGFDPKIMRKVVRIRRMDDAGRREEELVLDTYMHAMGMTPIEAHLASPAEELQQAAE